jgi:effector-binding domain-containing protein
MSADRYHGAPTPYDYTIRTLAPQPVMSIRGWTTAAELSQAIGQRLPAVWRYVREVGGMIAGPPFTRYHAVEGDRVDLEAGLPVRSALPPKGEIKPRELPGGEAAVVTHVGPYEGLPATGAALAKWVAARGRTAAGPNWELYVTDPGAEPNPEKWRTEIVKPLATSR